MQPTYSQVPSGSHASRAQEHDSSLLEAPPDLDGETTQPRDGRREETIPLRKDNRGQPKQSSITQAEDVDVENSDSHVRALFQPFWLGKPLLIALLVTFLIFWVVLVILYRVASSEQGLSLKVTSSHYVWTYGPTVILTFVLSLWRQTDYYCKLTQPWREMTAKPAAPQQSVLLDYVSPMYAISFYKALRRGHIPVAVSVTGFWLLKLVIVVSTGLLEATPTSHSVDRPVQLSSAFNVSKMWDRISDRKENVTNLRPGYVNATTDVLWAYLDQLNGQAPDANQVKDNKIFQSFELLESSDNITSAHATVDVFTPIVTCEAAQVKAPHQNMTGYFVPVEFESSSCSFTTTQSIKMWDQRFNATSLVYSLDLADCSTTTNISSETHMTNAHFAAAVVVYRNPIFPTKNFRKTDPDENAIIKANAVTCKVDYGVQKVDLRRNFVSDDVELRDPSTSAAANLDMTSTELSRYISGSLDEGTDELQIETEIPDWALQTESRVLFPLMYKHLGSSANNESFFDQEKLKESATSVFQGLVLQVAQLELLQPARINSTGSVTLSVDRLQIRKAPLIVMIVSLALLTCLTPVVMLAVRRRVVPQSPGSIASYASILARSSTLEPLLKDTGSMRTSGLTRKLNGFQYQVRHSEHAFEIEATSGSQELVRTTKPKIKHAQWIPWAARIPLLALVFALPLLIIAVLEILQQASNRNNGVAELNDGDSGAISYVIRYGSILSLLLVATLFNNLDFTITTVAPFHALRSGKASARESISLNLVGQIPLVALFSCLRHKHFGTALSIFAAFVGSFLTIVSSGLWIADYQVLDSMNVKSDLGSSWNFTWSDNSSDDAGASKLLNTLDFGGSHDPVGTWTSFAVPTLGKMIVDGKSGKAVNPAKNGSSPLQRYEFDINGLQPELNCTVCPKEDILYDETPTSAIITTNGTDHPIMSKSLEAYFQLSPHCRSADSKNSSVISFNYAYTNDSTGEEPSLIGRFYDLNVSLARTDPSSSAKQLPSSEGCPSIGILFGHFQNITAVLCSQRIRSVSMTVTYSGDPAVGILDAQYPPVVSDSGPPKYMLDASTGQSSFSYRVQQHLTDGLSYYPTSKQYNQDLPSVGNMEDIEPVFDHLLNGPYNASIATILGRDHTQGFITAVNSLYNKYMVQVLNTVLRSPPGNVTIEKAADGGIKEPEAATVNGRLIRQVTRLKMNNASKLTLQIMLAVMIVLSAAAVRLVKIRGTLPRDPYSMASVMGFLAGSRMCDPASRIIPHGSEFLSTDRLDKLFDGHSFRLGWWSGPPDVGGRGRTTRSASPSLHDGSGGEQHGSSAGEAGERHSPEKQRRTVVVSVLEARSRFGIDVDDPSSLRAGKEIVDDGSSL